MTEEVAVEKLENNFFYALYSYRPGPQSSPNDKGDNVNEKATENSGFSLSHILSNLPESTETSLSQFLFTKISKGLLYNDASSISSFMYSEGDLEKEMYCYYCKLSGSDSANMDINLGKGDSGDSGPKAHVVCFLTLHENMLDQHELDMYALGLFKFLEQENEAQVKLSMERWSYETTEYLCRSLRLVGQDIKYLMYAALMDAQLVFDGVESSVQQDLIRFVRSCSLGDILKQTESPLSGSLDMLADLNISEDKKRTVQIKADNDGLKFEPEYCTKFCDDWSQSVNSLSTDNPGLIRQFIEAGKMKYTQSINTLKRLMMQAENDFYALYRAYMFLKNSGNCEILLNCAHLDSIPETYNVFKCLEEFVKETGVR